MVPQKKPATDFRKRDEVVEVKPLLVPLVSTSRQKNGLKDEQAAEIALIREQAGIEVEGKKHLPQVMGGGSVESGGDGTGFPGGVSLDYWEVHLASKAALMRLLGGGREGVAGVDYPTEGQMAQARKFARARAGKEIEPSYEELEGDDIGDDDRSGYGIVYNSRYILDF